MQVSKWGNSLAVRIPAAVVEALELREGDEIEVRVSGPRNFDVRRDQAFERSMKRIRKLRGSLPADFVFSRDEANAR